MALDTQGPPLKDFLICEKIKYTYKKLLTNKQNKRKNVTIKISIKEYERFYKAKEYGWNKYIFIYWIRKILVKI